MKSSITKAVLVALLGVCLFVSLFVSAAANAQTLYRWVDKDGKVQYSDMPPPANAKNTQQKRLGDNLIEQDKMPYALRMAVQNNPVILYANDCGNGCDAARALLNKRGIPFVDRNPQKDAEAAKALTALAGALEVPTIAIGGSKVSGFTESKWNSALDSAGYSRSNTNTRSAAPKPAPVVPVAPAVTPPVDPAPADTPPASS